MSHVGLSVANIERSIEFYRQAFGMEVIVQANFDGGPHAQIMALDGAKGRVALLKAQCAGLLQVELFEFENPPPKPADPNRPVCDRGITHFCISVSDVEKEYERLKAAGMLFHCRPLLFQSGNKAVYGRDPDGNVIELHERAKTPS